MIVGIKKNILKADEKLAVSLPRRRTYFVFLNFMEEDQWGMEKCGVLHFDGIQWLACRAISESAELFERYRNSITYE